MITPKRPERATPNQLWQSDLFTFIHDGLPGGMPQWAGTLSDNQIWDVINFLRSLKGS